MEKLETPVSEQAYVLTSTRHSKISGGEIPFKTRLKILFGGKFWLTTKAHIKIKQELEPIPIEDGIELFINVNEPKDGK